MRNNDLIRIAASFICWLRFSYKSNTKRSRNGWASHFQPFELQEEKATAPLASFFRDLSITNFISPYWLNCSRVFLCLKSQREGLKWMDEDTRFSGGIHSISNRLCVYLAVLGQWRREKLAFYKNPEKKGPERKDKADLLRASASPCWKRAHLPGSQGLHRLQLSFWPGSQWISWFTAWWGFRLHGIVHLLD